MPSRTERLADATLRHAVYLEGRSNALESRIAKIMQRQEAQMIKLLRRGSRDFPKQSQRLMTEVTREIRRELAEEILREQAYQIRQLGLIGKVNPISYRQAERMVGSMKFGDKNLSNHMRQIAKNRSRWAKQSLRTAEDQEKALRRLIRGRGRRSSFALARRQARAVVGTFHTHATNNIRETVWKRSRLFRQVQWVSILDDRTSHICLGLHGQVFKANQGPRPPMHIFCRSMVLPIYRGEGPASFPSVDAWLRRQPHGFQDQVLGKGKAQLFRAGEIEIQDLSTTRGATRRARTLKEVRRRVAGKTEGVILEISGLRGIQDIKRTRGVGETGGAKKKVVTKKKPATTSNRANTPKLLEDYPDQASRQARIAELRAAPGSGLKVTAEIDLLYGYTNEATSKILELATQNPIGAKELAKRLFGVGNLTYEKIIRSIAALEKGAGRATKKKRVSKKVVTKRGDPSKRNKTPEPAVWRTYGDDAGRQRRLEVVRGQSAGRGASRFAAERKLLEGRWDEGVGDIVAEMRASLKPGAPFGPQTTLRWAERLLGPNHPSMKVLRGILNEAPVTAGPRLGISAWNLPDPPKKFPTAEGFRERVLATVPESATGAGQAAINNTFLNLFPEVEEFRFGRMVINSQVTNPTAAREGISFLNRIFKNFERIPTAPLRVFTDGSARSFHRGSVGIFLNGNYSAKTMVHEMGHWLEHHFLGLSRKSRAFLKRRTQGERARRLDKMTGNPNYGRYEKARADQFQNPYTGKIYDSRLHASGSSYRSTEILSMGLQYLYEDPAWFARTDPDFFDFVIEVITKGLPKTGAP